MNIVTYLNVINSELNTKELPKASDNRVREYSSHTCIFPQGNLSIFLTDQGEYRSGLLQFNILRPGTPFTK